jgi:hypothetical protein
VSPGSGGGARVDDCERKRRQLGVGNPEHLGVVPVHRGAHEPCRADDLRAGVSQRSAIAGPVERRYVRDEELPLYPRAELCSEGPLAGPGGPRERDLDRSRGIERAHEVDERREEIGKEARGCGRRCGV